MNKSTPISQVATAPIPDSESELTEAVIIPVIEEEAEITRRTVETGRVRLHKYVTEETVNIDEPSVYEEYVIERIAMNRIVSEAEGPRMEGSTTIISVYEEEIVTTTRLILREEIHLKKIRREERRPTTIVLRKENVDIERTSPSPSEQIDR